VHDTQNVCSMPQPAATVYSRNIVPIAVARHVRCPDIPTTTLMLTGCGLEPRFWPPRPFAASSLYAASRPKGRHPQRAEESQPPKQRSTRARETCSQEQNLSWVDGLYSSSKVSSDWSRQVDASGRGRTACVRCRRNRCLSLRSGSSVLHAQVLQLQLRQRQFLHQRQDTQSEFTTKFHRRDANQDARDRIRHVCFLNVCMRNFFSLVHLRLPFATNLPH